MNESNPYNSLEAPAAAFAAASERAAFLKKVYGILFLGMLGFAATLWAAANVPAVNELAMSIGRAIYGSRFGWLLYIGLFMGASFAVHSLAERSPINVVAYAAYVVVMALLIAPIVLMVNGMSDGAEIIRQASLLTALLFGGMTVYVLWSGKDFSWLRGTISMLFWGLLVAGLVGWLTGFSFGLLMSWGVLVLIACYILYDTSRILHQLPTTMAMTAAVLLFTNVVLLFKHILILVASSRD
jgi:FtsH-binding integral membrane protein